MFLRAGAYAIASRKKRMEELNAEFNNSDDENYVEPEKRNYLCKPNAHKPPYVNLTTFRQTLAKDEKDAKVALEGSDLPSVSLWPLGV